MRIGIDARMLGKGFGLARYTEQLIMHLLQVESTYHYVLFVRSADQLEGLPIDRARITVIEANIRWYSLAEQLRFGRIIQKARVDLMHFPHWNVPYFFSDPFVVTVHDLIMYHYPRPDATTLGPLVYRLKDWAHRRVVAHAVRAARHVIVTSEWTKHDVHDTLGVPNKKMTVIYQAPATMPAGAAAPEPQKQYALYVGAAYPHKNLHQLVDAWELMQTTYGTSYELILVGQPNAFYERLLRERPQIGAAGSSVRYMGFMTDKALSALYAGARVYVFASLYEGFGLPPLEAMAQGVPVVSSNRSCLPEVLADAAHYFDPEDSADMADAIYLGLTSQLLRDRLAHAAQNRLEQFSAERMAEETVRIYRDVRAGVGT